MSVRRIYRPPRTSQFNNSPNSTSSENNSDECQNNYNFAPMPKHVSFPVVPYNSDFMNELVVFAFTLLSGTTQFLQLYRTMWFLNGSHLNNKTVNFHLIDKYLTLFIVVMIARRLVFCCLIKIAELTAPQKYEFLIKRILKYAYFGVLVVVFVGCSIKVCQKHNYLYLFCLSYPIILYLFIFRLKIDPFLRTQNSESIYMSGMPLHSCSTNANTVREEIDSLKTDFNNRFKQVIFTSVLNAYYCGFIPCCFVHKHLYYDTYWATQHLFFVWISGFTMLVAQCFPVKYSDVLHRASRHLGQWNRISRSHHPPPLPWSKNTIWSMGSYVKYLGEIYRSKSGCTAAIPGNSSHHRFYAIFKNPSVLYLFLAGIVLSVVIIQLFILSISISWHNTISICFLLLSNFMTLFTLMRDFLVAKYVYATEIENSSNDKSSTSVHSFNKYYNLSMND